MRILLDQNLSPKLIRALADALPGLESVYDHGLTGATDPTIFVWAAKSGFAAILSADLDFVRLVERIGQPPKIIRIERCDFSSKVIALLRREIVAIRAFLASTKPVLSLKVELLERPQPA